MIALTGIERKEHCPTSLYNEPATGILDEAPECLLPVYPNQDRPDVISGTINNLINSGVLLPPEVEGYKGILNGYDNDTLFRVFLQSKELKNNTPRHMFIRPECL